MQSLPKSVELYMQIGDSYRLENILMVRGAQPRFTWYETKDLTASELMALYLRHAPKGPFDPSVDYEKMNIWDTLFVAKGYKKGYTMEHVFGHCLGEEFARVGLPEGPAMGTRSKTAIRKMDSFVFESNENKVILPPTSEDYGDKSMPTMITKEEVDYSDMPALITVEHSKTLEALETKERALTKEAKELDRLEVKVKEVQALYDMVGPRRMIWVCEELEGGEAGLDALKVDYEKEAAELDVLEAKVAAVKALKATIPIRRAALVAAANELI